MIVHEFILRRQPAWAQLQTFLGTVAPIIAGALPLDSFRQGSAALYRQAVADLAYARMCYPVIPWSESSKQPVGSAHSILYQAGRTKSRSWLDFWRDTWPARVRQAARPILLATSIFWVSAGLGVLLTVENPTLEVYREPGHAAGHRGEETLDGIAHPHSAGGLERDCDQQYQRLARDLVLGLTFGIGTVWLLVLNGLMLGPLRRRASAPVCSCHSRNSSSGTVRSSCRQSGSAAAPVSSWLERCSFPAAIAAESSYAIRTALGPDHRRHGAPLARRRHDRGFRITKQHFRHCQGGTRTLSGSHPVRLHRECAGQPAAGTSEGEAGAVKGRG